MLGSRTWGAGPSVVVLTMPGHWVLGALANQVWSIGGNHDRSNTSAFLTQYFANQNLPDGYYLTSATIITADWEVAGRNKWRVPVKGGFGKVFRIRKLPCSCRSRFFSH